MAYSMFDHSIKNINEAGCQSGFRVSCSLSSWTMLSGSLYEPSIQIINLRPMTK